MKIYRRVSKKNYLHGKRTYAYERFYVPVPKRFHNLIKAFLGKELKVKVELAAEGFTVRVQAVSRSKQALETQNSRPRRL
ncbi:hypothetical protein KEJ33_05840 [Candidatus Bathyarchaeota archaeon]|nr:hypothetical protein [Candidatus Bathyarchaeota archaeon]